MTEAKEYTPASSAAEQFLREMVERAATTSEQVFGSFLLLRLLGFEVGFGTDTCTVGFEVVPPLFNPQGTLHGGVLATALDVSMGHLLHKVAGVGTTLEMKVQYLAPVTTGRVTCESSFLRRGGSICYLQAHARRADRELIAHATATWKLLKPSLTRG
jgi:uncharacterized protein (TIGR00369 family)